MTTSADELDHDRTTALRMIAPRRTIESRSIEAYCGRWVRASDEARVASAASLPDEAKELWDGEAVLVLPDGSRWVHVNALVRRDPAGANRYLQRLLQLLRAHVLRRDHRAASGALTDFFLDAASLDLRHVFCHECTRCLDLDHDSA